MGKIISYIIIYNVIVALITIAARMHQSNVYANDGGYIMADVFGLLLIFLISFIFPFITYNKIQPGDAKAWYLVIYFTFVLVDIYFARIYILV